MNNDKLTEVLKKYHLRPNFTYGQNFLVDDIVLQDIVDAAEVSSDDTVLEIGPGVGNLTELLCQRAGFVLSVEKDDKFFPILKAIKKNHKDNFRYEIADILEFDFQSAIQEILASSGVILSPSASEGEGSHPRLRDSSQKSLDVPLGMTPRGGDYKVVANIPYYITGKILRMFFEAEFKPSAIVILTQKEVAQNLVAGPGKLSLLAISVQLYGKPEIVQIVQAKSFYPAPKVDSAIVKIQTYPEPKYSVGDEKKFFRLLRGCFAGKRKQLHNTLVHNLRLDKNQVTEILSELKINPAARPQELSIEQWVELYNKIEM